MKRTKKGFTLVELLVVIAIIAIIAAVAVPVTIGQLKKGRVSNFTQEKEAIVRMITTASASAKKPSELSAEITFNKQPDSITGFTIAAHQITFTTSDKILDGDVADEDKIVAVPGVDLTKFAGAYTIADGAIATHPDDPQ